MVINFKQGDLIPFFKQRKFDVIASQANCHKMMNMGIAGALVKDFPKLREVDIDPVYGGISTLETEFGKIVNLYGQFQGGRCTINGEDSFTKRCAMLKNALINLRDIHKPKTLGLPLLASGIACHYALKGNMTDLEYFKMYIQPIVEQVFELIDTNITIVYL